MTATNYAPLAKAAPQSTVSAKSTIVILNVVRVAGTGMFALFAIISLVAAVVMASSDDATAFVVGGFASALLMLVLGALFFAVVGWFCDSLSMLERIARNTGPQIV